MAQGCGSNCGDVIEADIKPAGHERYRFGSHNDGLRAAWTSSIAHVAIDECAGASAGLGGDDQPACVCQYVGWDRDAPHGGLHFD